MKNQVNWIPNVSAGTWTVGPSETDPEAESASVSNGAKVITCSGCNGGKAVGNIGGSGHGAVTFSGISSQSSGKTTIRIKYENGDSSQRFASVSVNGQAQTLAFLPSADGNTPATSVLNAQLNSGSSNTITVTTTDGSWGPDVDRLMVPNS
jgi:hypothetical protein